LFFAMSADAPTRAMQRGVNSASRNLESTTASLDADIRVGDMRQKMPMDVLQKVPSPPVG